MAGGSTNGPMDLRFAPITCDRRLELRICPVQLGSSFCGENSCSALLVLISGWKHSSYEICVVSGEMLENLEIVILELVRRSRRRELVRFRNLNKYGGSEFHFPRSFMVCLYVLMDVEERISMDTPVRDVNSRVFVYMLRNLPDGASNLHNFRQYLCKNEVETTTRTMLVYGIVKLNEVSTCLTLLQGKKYKYPHAMNCCNFNQTFTFVMLLSHKSSILTHFVMLLSHKSSILTHFGILCGKNFCNRNINTEFDTFSKCLFRFVLFCFVFCFSRKLLKNLA